jgi:hypothetical protein
MEDEYYFKDNLLYIVLGNIDGITIETFIDAEDFERIDVVPKWGVSKTKNRETFYVQGYYEGRTIGMHRWIMNPPLDKVVDHINRNPLDNRRCNLRILTQGENLQNKRVYKNSKSGVRGVYWDKIQKLWKAQYRLNGKAKHLGRFETIEEAEKVVKEARNKYMKYAN